MSIVELCGVPVHALLEDAAAHPLPLETVVTALTAWAQENGTELKQVGQKARRRDEHISGLDDPMVEFLEAKGMIRGEGNSGEVQIWCPWQHEHSGDSGPSETVWFPAGTNGYKRGGFKCQHAHCDGRGTADFEQEIGFYAEDFDVLPPFSEPLRARAFSRSDYFGIAQSALQKLWQQDGNKLLLRTQGTWYEFNGTHYLERSEEHVRRRLWAYLDMLKVTDHHGNLRPLRPNKGYVTGIIDALSAPAGFENVVVPPCWLPGTSGPDPRLLVVLTDGVLDITRRELLPHDPRLFATNALPFAWGEDEEVDEPTAWLAFLGSLWGDDQEAIKTLQEMFGYLLTPDTSQQKMFMVLGPRRSGKGTIGRVLRALLGDHNYCGPSMASFAGEFGLEPLIGKLVALFPDARTGGLKMNSQAVVEKLLQISGEDTMSINRKHKSYWTGRLQTRVVVLSNEPPKLGDASGALSGRFVVLSLKNSFYGQEDPALEAKLLAELPAILRWALDGRERLNRRGYFIQPASGRPDLEDMKALGNPVGVFVAECCELDPEAEEPFADLYQAWCAWCSKNGHHSGSNAYFGRSLRVVCPNLQKARPRVADSAREDARVYSYRGIRLLAAVKAETVSGSL